ncbi:MAG: DUF362 domain-containing protein [Nitrospiraceae bacterium]
MAQPDIAHQQEWTRRDFLKALAGGVVLGSGVLAAERFFRPRLHAHAFITKVSRYELEIGHIISQGLRELGVRPEEVKGKRILLKPNLVETSSGAIHINTHPLVMRGAVEAFLRLGAAKVLVAEGPGHRRDTLDVLEESGLADVLYDDRIPFADLNYGTGYTVSNIGRHSKLKTLTFPGLFQEMDWIVSMAKMKTHHWAGVTLSMKNLFGVMPGIYYGWPKNVLHQVGIENSILDINATLRPHFAIVDGIVGMEGDGPIMGTPRQAGVLVMGRNLPAVDATCARIMGINPQKITYLARTEDKLGPISDTYIEQRGETIASVRTNFALVEKIPAQKGIRLLM